MTGEVNQLAFGMPGTGKTHAMCAIGHRLVQAGRSVLFIPAYRLLQETLTAKRYLDLPRDARASWHHVRPIPRSYHDLGYLPQGAEEYDISVHDYSSSATSAALWA